VPRQAKRRPRERQQQPKYYAGPESGRSLMPAKESGRQPEVAARFGREMTDAYLRFDIAVRSKENLAMTVAPHQLEVPLATPLGSPVSVKHAAFVRSVS